MRLKPTAGQRWRVSVYPPGVTDNLPTDYPLTHKSSRDQSTAQTHFDRFASQIGNGKIGRVILHQGKLYTGCSQYMHNDTQWWPNKYAPNNVIVARAIARATARAAYYARNAEIEALNKGER